MLAYFKTGLGALAFMSVVACDEEPGTTPDTTHPPALTYIALGSCNVQLLPQTFWSQIASEKPQLFIYAGDNVYADLEVVDGEVKTGQERPDVMAAAYKTLGDAPAFQSFRNEVPIYPIWDDHDFGSGDGGATFVNKADSEQQFLNFWNIPEDDDRRARPGIYTSSIHGPVGKRVQIIMLDTRYFRSDLKKPADAKDGNDSLSIPHDDPSTTILGDAQWAWLAEELKKEADVRLIVSSIQVHAEGHGYERWGNFPHERSRLYDLIAETRANGVIFLSGDRHSGALYLKRSEDHYPLFEMTSSSLNRPYPNPDETGPYQLDSLFGETNYATITFDWENRAVVLQIKDMDGQPVRSAGLEIDGLR